MTSPPLLLRLQAASPITSPVKRDALTMTTPARPKQLRFFKLFPPPRRRVNPTTLAGDLPRMQALPYPIQKTMIAHFDGTTGGVFPSGVAGLCSGGVAPASFN